MCFQLSSKPYYTDIFIPVHIQAVKTAIIARNYKLKHAEGSDVVTKLTSYEIKPHTAGGVKPTQQKA